jgi:hypothetical protein
MKEFDIWALVLLIGLSASVTIANRSRDPDGGGAIAFFMFIAVYGLAATGRILFLLIEPWFI